MSTPETVTLVKGAIHNPNEPRHFMRIVPAAGRQVAVVDATVIADSVDAVVVREVGLDIYEGVVYFPRVDVAMSSLRKSATTSHCPLKGDTVYFDILADDGSVYSDGAWSYTVMVAGDELRDLIAFDASQVQLLQSEGPQS